MRVRRKLERHKAKRHMLVRRKLERHKAKRHMLVRNKLARHNFEWERQKILQKDKRYCRKTKDTAERRKPEWDTS